MADQNNRSTALETVAWAAKILFLSIGIFSSLSIITAYFLTLLSSISFTQLYNSALSCLVPPYLFIIVNFIIIVIWKLHNQHPAVEPKDITSLDDSTEITPSSRAIQTITSLDSVEIKKCIDDETRDDDLDSTWRAIKNSRSSSPSSSSSSSSPSSSSSSSSSSSDVVAIKKCVDHHRPWPPPLETQETIEKDLDETWTAIMNGKSSPAKNQPIKKSGTWEKTNPKPVLSRAEVPPVVSREFVKSDTFRDRSEDTEEEGVKKKEMRKSKTFRETIRDRPSVGWRGRDVLVVSHDELFKKVEAFIKMNYDQMKLQRKESEQRRSCVEMMNATAY